MQFCSGMIRGGSNRASEKHLKHRCGSKSLSVRVAAVMKDGVVPPLKEIYQSTHYNKDTNEWISPGCKDKFDEMEKIEAEHNSQEGAVPMTQEDLSIKVFKKRSGYIMGLGMRPSSSVRSYVNSYEYVTNLEKKVQERDEIIQEHVEKIEVANATIVELVAPKEQANATIADLVEAKEQQGRTLASVLEFLKQQGYTGVS
ncbi:hypothetical protein Vadar_032916 [Vaccinium darrowii]|uniref:Uncharacterized protein n=1 Tax=Vaccinium darrowii TaxID=229202 RepID=A0ACB7X617_9ERIC|nr:hypothetical protein Vadar_032916 [Vaccinium darrowii]